MSTTAPQFLTKVTTQFNSGDYFEVYWSFDPRHIDINSLESKQTVATIKNFKMFFVGTDNARSLYGPSYKYKQDGNTVVIHLKESNYMFVSRDIWKFDVTDGDEILEYFSPTGNSYVPYPYAVGVNNTYLLAEIKDGSCPFIKNEDLINKDPYKQYYGLETDEKALRNICNGYTNAIQILEYVVIDCDR